MMTPLAKSSSPLQERRERVFLLLAGFFLCAMTLLNVIGITRFVQLGAMQLAVGVLPYPLTFLCTDLISELYGKQRARFMVTVGLLLNLFVLLIMYICNTLPAVDAIAQPSWQTIELAKQINLANGKTIEGSVELFRIVYSCTAGAVFASMLAYVVAQYVDVYLFHFWKNLTNGRHLWLRNNFSTLLSQLTDSIVVISVTFGLLYLDGKIPFKVLLGLMLSNYLFKMAAALFDTPIIYFLVYKFRAYLELESKAKPTGE